MLSARLHFRRDAEHAGVFQAVGVFEVVEGFVEDEVGFAFNTGQAFLQTLIQCIQTLIERFGIALIALGIGRVGGAQVSGHFVGNNPCVHR